MATKKKATNGDKKKKPALALFLPEDVMAALMAAKESNEKTLGVSLTRQQMVIGILKKALNV